jgi:hypothetical protein
LEKLMIFPAPMDSHVTLFHGESNDAAALHSAHHEKRVWGRRIQTAKEMAHLIQDQITALNRECSVLKGLDPSETPTVPVHHVQFEFAQVQLDRLAYLMKRVPLSALDERFVMGRLKACCCHLRQIEMWASVHGEARHRPHSRGWRSLVRASQKLRALFYEVIGQGASVH